MNRTPLVEKLLEAASKHAMFVRGASVVVAISGGPDSTALLHAFCSIQSELDISIVAAHFEHGIRGEESLADAEYVSAICTSLDVKLYIEHADIPAIAKRLHLSVQEAARRERHRFLREAAASVFPNGSARIAIAHTADDRAETILLNIIRGAGTDGLGAMPPVRLPIVRPLIDVTRAEVEAYCSVNGLNPRTDSTNSKLDYTRNRVRAELLPLLAAYYNKGVREALLRLGGLASEDSAALNRFAEELFRTAVRLNSEDGVCLNSAMIALAPRALQRRVVRLGIAHVRGNLTDIDLGAVDAILDGLERENITDRTLVSVSIGRGGVCLQSTERGGDKNGEIHVRSSRSILEIRCVTPARQAPNWQSELLVPGRVQLPMSGRWICADRVAAGAVHETPSDGDTVYFFRAADVGEKLQVRTWKTGDKMHPKGMAGTKKLQDLYTDCKVRSSERHQYPVLTTATDTILAVLGLRAGERSLNGMESKWLAKEEPQSEVVRVLVTDASPKRD